MRWHVPAGGLYKRTIDVSVFGLMFVRQDEVDVDEATDEDLAELKAWKKYRVALNRMPDQAGYPQAIDWPSAPA